MKLLALDTAASRCSVALYCEGALIERDIPAERVHAENILPMVEQLLGEARLSLRELDAIAFGRGPGAFTGLRVAAAVTQGFAYGAGLPVVPVSNLAALAYATARRHGVRQVLACLDARMQEIYWAPFTVSGEVVQPLGAEALCPPAELLPPGDGPWFAAGSAWAAYGEVLRTRVTALTGVDAALAASAGDIARLAEHAFKQGQSVAPEQALPVYLRDKVATPKL